MIERKKNSNNKKKENLVNNNSWVYLKWWLKLEQDKTLNPGLVGRVFTNGLEDLGSIPGRVIPKTLKMVLNTSLLNTQQ